MQQIDETQHVKALLSANTIDANAGDSLIDVFTALGPDALKRLRSEGVVRTLDEVEERFMDEVVMGGGMRPKFSEDAMHEEFNNWVNKEYQEVGKDYVHVYDLCALEAVIFDMSHDWLTDHNHEGSVVDALTAFISKQEIADLLTNVKKESISKPALM